MACGCEDITCVDVYVNPCSTGTDTGIVASQTGNYRALLEFNGVSTNFSVAVTTGEKISFPTFLLNEDYKHQLKLFDTSDEFIGCYSLNTHIALNIADYPVTPPETAAWQWGELTVNGNTVDSNLLTGDISPIIWLNEQPLNWANQGITQTSTGLDFTTIGGAYGNLVFQYKNI